MRNPHHMQPCRLRPLSLGLAALAVGAIAGCADVEPSSEMWDGYIEAWPGASDRLRVEIGPADNYGRRTGVVIFGEGFDPAPATDPNIGYPPGISMLAGGPGALATPIEGTRYPITAAIVEPSRVRVTFDLGVTWRDWCALQTSFPEGSSGDSFSCLPNSGFTSSESGCTMPNPAGGPEVVVDCGKVFLCDGANVCVCDAAGCVASTMEMNMDFHVVGAHGDGSLLVAGTHNIHLTR